MKQETAPASKAESKGSGMSQSPTTTTPSRLRASAKSRDSPKTEALLSPALRGRATTTHDVMKTNANLRSTRRSLVLTKPKSRDEVVGSQKGREMEEVRVVGRSGNRPVAAEQFARPRRLLRPMDYDQDGKKKELVEKLELSETLIKNLQDEVLALKAGLEKAQSLNVELQAQNKKLTENLSAAEAKIATLSSPQQKDSSGEYQRPNFKDIQKLIAHKLENQKVKKETRITEVISIAKLPSPGPPPPPLRLLKTVDIERKAPSHTSLQPPPPPPPPPPSRATAPRKTPSFEEFYQTLTKQEGKKVPAPLGPGNHNKPATTNAHNSIVGEIQNRSAHLLAVKADIATKGEFINGLIEKVQSAAYANIEDVLKFVDWLDGELSSLADERAVLKHFKWPEKKADVMREAAIEYRGLKLLENEISSFQDDINVPCGAALKRMASLLDKSERSIQRLIKLRNSVMRSYQECKIPTDWMLDSGIVSTIKKASMKLAKVYMKRVTMELESARNSDRGSAQEALLLQGVHFAYRAHQFAGGLDSETMCAIEEIRQRVPGHLGGSQELLAS